MNDLKVAYPKFVLDKELTEEHFRFFNTNGFIQFKGFLSPEYVKRILDSLEELQNKWITQHTELVNGIPIHYGFDENNNKIVHRFAFTSLNDPVVHELVNSARIMELIKLLGIPGGRIAENEKDGVVVNQYINSEKSQRRQMGWHTDSLRDLFYYKKVMPMLNVGVCLTDSKKEQGGLKVLPGSHKQDKFNMLFRKPYFISNKPDKDEVSIEADAGDVTVHHGHIWHRVAMAPTTGQVSKRIVMYIPIICGPFSPKNENSATPFYHKLKSLATK